MILSIFEAKQTSLVFHDFSSQSVWGMGLLNDTMTTMNSDPVKKMIQVFGIFCTMFGEWLYRVMDDRVANCCLAAILLLGTAMTAIIPSDYR